MGPNISSIRTFRNDSWYLLASKKRYPAFIDEYNLYSSKYDAMQEEKNNDIMNQL